MTISKVIKSTIPSCTYVFKDGSILEFIGGKATTDSTEYYEELIQEIKIIGQNKSKHPFIYVDADEQEIDSEALSPFEELKAKARKEVEEEFKRAMNNGNSTSAAGNFAASVSNTSNNIPVGDSNSGAILTPIPSGTSGVQAAIAAMKSKT